MKKFLSFILTIISIFAMQSVIVFGQTASNSQIDSVEVEYFDDGTYCVTVIESIPADINTIGSSTISPLSTKTETKSKTEYVKSTSGSILWYVKVTGTFTYGDGSAKCTSVTPSAAAIASTWKVSDISGSKSGNKASATATGKQYADGKVVQTMTRTVTLTCSPTGVFS